ncbi:MAG TPA: PAS domain S-box protein [Thermodesulfovibrionales bacterium]|nr:PAS domain S-box protein [Thermodesulfovibrionales bacterium]
MTKITELERFASFPRLNPNPVLEVGSSGEILFINNAAKAILQKLNLGEEGEVFLPQDIQVILKALNHKNEKEFYREVTIRDNVFGENLYLVPEFHAVRIYAHDITEHKKMEEEIRRAEMLCKKERDFTSLVLSTAGALVVVLDVKGRIVSFNRTCEQVTGYSFDEVRGRPFWDFLLLPEEIESVKSVFKELYITT